MNLNEKCKRIRSFLFQQYYLISNALMLKTSEMPE